MLYIHTTQSRTQGIQTHGRATSHSERAVTRILLSIKTRWWEIVNSMAIQCSQELPVNLTKIRISSAPNKVRKLSRSQPTTTKNWDKELRTLMHARMYFVMMKLVRRSKTIAKMENFTTLPQRETKSTGEVKSSQGPSQTLSTERDSTDTNSIGRTTTEMKRVRRSGRRKITWQELSWKHRSLFSMTRPRPKYVSKRSCTVILNTSQRRGTMETWWRLWPTGETLSRPTQIKNRK